LLFALQDAYKLDCKLSYKFSDYRQDGFPFTRSARDIRVPLDIYLASPALQHLDQAAPGLTGRLDAARVGVTVPATGPSAPPAQPRDTRPASACAS
jgi:hypothetical protein